MRGFDKDGFMKYMEDCYYGFSNSFLRELAENVIDFGIWNKNVSLDQLLDWLCDMIPEVTPFEVCTFCDDSILTSYSRQMKAEAMEEMKIVA